MNDPLIINVLSLLIAVGAVAFVVMFAREPWWRSWFGRSLMAMAGALVVFALVVVLTLWLGRHYPGREALRVTGYSLVAVAIWSRVYVLWRVRRDDRKHLPVD
ncbi:putative phage holin [Mumia sp. DW29H23]|uniref:putative phage holin n=1 Tax=Mumia sp. DW29H23 TaxID=3421241 RepID=UPI003D69926C